MPLKFVWLPCAGYHCLYGKKEELLHLLKKLLFRIHVVECMQIKHSTIFRGTAKEELNGMKTFKFKLYRSKKTRMLHHQLWVACNIYNHALALHRRYWKLFHKSLSKFNLQKHITKLKKLPRFAFWNDIPSHAIHDITNRIERGYKLFWKNLKNKRKTALPKFKSWRKYRSLSYDMVGSSVISGNVIKIAGGKYKFFKSREIEGMVKLLTVKRDACGDFFVYLVCDTPEVRNETRMGKSIGFDFSFKGTMLVAEKQENDIPGPAFFRMHKDAIAKASRTLSKKKKGSNNREKARLELARLYRRVANQRHDFQWRLARELCRKYSVICLEDLDMKWMQMGHGRKVNEYGFAELNRLLEYVGRQFGTAIVHVNRFFPSSQLCNTCGFQNRDVSDMRIRAWDCPKCGTHHDRDRNAAKNIHEEGLRILSDNRRKSEIQSGRGIVQ